MPQYVNWKYCDELGYEILHVRSVCWLEFTTHLHLPKADNLQILFKE